MIINHPRPLLSKKGGTEDKAKGKEYGQIFEVFCP